MGKQPGTCDGRWPRQDALYFFASQPFDLAAELHLRFDAVAVAYRTAMRDLGLAASTPIGIAAE